MKRKNPSPVVVLADTRWIGHHPMYFTQFTSSFLRNGARVIGLCPQPEEARADLESTGTPDERKAWQASCHFAALATPHHGVIKRIAGDPFSTFRRWRATAAALRSAEQITGWNVDLVFFPYLDNFLRFLPFPCVPEITISKPWSGLYFRNHHHAEPASLKQTLRNWCKGEAILRSKLCRGIGVLDERFIPQMQKHAAVTISPFPDVTRVDLPTNTFPLATTIQQKAAGRTIVGMIGLEKRKGVLHLIRTAKRAADQNQPFYFVCGGAIYRNEYSATEWQEIQWSAAELENLHLDPDAGRIASEADFNALFRIFDIAWVAYENFQGSSGALGKAAHFSIPCLAAAGGCVGSRVDRYQLGRVIPSPEPEHALPALIALRSELPAHPRFAQYREDHSTDRLDILLRSLISPPVIATTRQPTN